MAGCRGRSPLAGLNVEADHAHRMETTAGWVGRPPRQGRCPLRRYSWGKDPRFPVGCSELRAGPRSAPARFLQSVCSRANPRCVTALRRIDVHFIAPRDGPHAAGMGVPEGFGARPVLRHTVRVASSQVRLVGHTTSALAGASGPNLDRDGVFGAGECVQGRHTRARGPVDHRQVNSGGIASGTHLVRVARRHGPVWAPLVVR